MSEILFQAAPHGPPREITEKTATPNAPKPPPRLAGNVADQVGDEGIRTPDLLRARQALSQLSYTPHGSREQKGVGPGRLELPTSRLSGVRSNQLSYGPDPGTSGA